MEGKQPQRFHFTVAQQIRSTFTHPAQVIGKNHLITIIFDTKEVGFYASVAINRQIEVLV